MFEIDLLKGRGRPRRTDLKRVAVGLAVLAMPVVAAAVYAAGVQQDRAKLASLERSAAVNEARLEDHAGGLRYLAELRRQIGDDALSLGEIGQALRYRRTASPFLVELAERLPSDISVREMNWRRSTQRERSVDSKTGQVRFETYIQRSIRLSLCGDEAAGSDASVQAYIGGLESSPALKPFLREIRPASRWQTEVDGAYVTVYEIEMLLKDQR